MYDLLKGLTVVEGATFIAGPTCALHMAQMGARVIRFDQIGGGPDAKRWPVDDAGHSLYWEGINKGKKSIGIDLSRPEGRELAQRLATSGDGLFVTNFPVEGYLSYERLAALRPDLICLRIMGWADGTPAVDYTINASVGLPWMTGQPDDPRPVNHVLPAWDLLAGAYAAFALMCAERDRTRSGQGREVRLALSDLAAATMGTLGSVAETIQGGDRGRAGNDLFGAFGRDFPTADGKRLMIVAITPRQWTGLVKVLGIDDAVAALEKRLGTSFARDEGVRFVHRAELVPLVAEAIFRRTAAELEPEFEANGVCWSYYRTLSAALTDEPRLFSDNPIFSSVRHPSGSYPTAGAPARIPGSDRGPAASAPRFGADTEEVLAELLGLGSGEIARLHDAGIVG
jgi:2-methylfumaryl-CoA isomerase